MCVCVSKNKATEEGRELGVGERRVRKMEVCEK